MAKKQKELPGMERPDFPEINAAAENYVIHRNKRLRALAREKDAKQVLLGAMAKFAQDTYKDTTNDPPLIVTISEGKKDVKVSEAVPEPEYEGEEDGDEENSEEDQDRDD